MLKLLNARDIRFTSYAEKLSHFYEDALFSDTSFAANIVEYQGEAAGIEFHEMKDGILYFDLHLSPENALLQNRHVFLGYENTMIRRFHPLKMIAFSCDPLLIALLKGNQYFAKGRNWQKIIEPWRYLIDDKCFDEEGFLINQGRMENIPFGWFNTKDKGCGWIAAYNLMRLNGKAVRMQEAAESIGKEALLGGVMGESFLLLYLWLKRHGLPVYISSPGNASAMKKMLERKNGILLYFHKQGAHYTMFENNGDGSVHFYNAVYGKQGHNETPESFMKRFTFLPSSMLIYIQ